MQYEVKKAEILKSVQFTNLLSFNLMENKLQRNFRSIVDALLLNQAKTQTLNQEHNIVKDKHEKQIHNLYKLINQMKNQLDNQQKDNVKVQSSSNQLIEKVSSHHSIKKLSEKQLSQHMIPTNQLNQIRQRQNNWEKDKNDFMDEIHNLKNKLAMLGYFENQMENLKNQVNQIKGQVAMRLDGGSKANLRSNKTIIKRESIMNLVANKASERQVQQLSKRSIKSLADENKQNQTNQAVQMGQVNVSQLLQKELNSIYLQLNTFKISFEQIKDILSDTKKQCYKNSNILGELKEDLNKQIKTRSSESEEFDKKIKQLKIELMNVGEKTVLETQQKKSPNQNINTNKPSNQENINYKNQMNDKLSKLQQILTQLPSQSEFNRLKNDLNEKYQKLSNKIQQIQNNQQDLESSLLDKIAENNHSNQEELNEMKNKIGQVEQNNQIEASQNERKFNILQAKNEQLKKSLQNLREDLEFYQSLMNDKNNKKSTQNLGSQNHQNKDDGRQSHLNGVNDKILQDMKRHFNNKLHDMRTNLLNIIRDLERKFSNNMPNTEQELIKIWDKVNQMNLFLNKKADAEDTKKTFLYLQKKINRLNSSVFKNEDNTEDARIARTNQWHCLSCDKNLQSYQGKIGKHIVWDSMPLKGMNKAINVTVNEEKKKALPQLNKRS